MHYTQLHKYDVIHFYSFALGSLPNGRNRGHRSPPPQHTKYADIQSRHQHSLAYYWWGHENKLFCAVGRQLPTASSLHLSYNYSIELLKAVISLWVSIRGHAFAKGWTMQFERRYKKGTRNHWSQKLMTRHSYDIVLCNFLLRYYDCNMIMHDMYNVNTTSLPSYSGTFLEGLGCTKVGDLLFNIQCL